MKCPVCKNTCSKSDNVCPTCGFTELHVEFINVEEAAAWERSVLRPCRALWNASQSMYEAALKKYQSIESQFSMLQDQPMQSAPIASPPSTKIHKVSSRNIVYEDEYVLVRYTGVDLDSYGELNIKCVAENKSTRNLSVRMETATCNGWDIRYYGNEGFIAVTASSKNRGAFTFSKFTELSEIKTLSGIEEFRYTIQVVDTDSYDTLSAPETYYYLDSVIKNRK